MVVERDGERVVLNQAYATSRIAGTSGPQIISLPEQEVRTTFLNTLTALPARPMSFLLYFLRGTDQTASHTGTLVVHCPDRFTEGQEGGHVPLLGVLEHMCSIVGYF